MEADYPAAHSMDTVWFAIDRDGRVGAFGYGWDGAVPQGAAQENINDLLDLLRGESAVYYFGSGLEEEAARLGLYSFRNVDSGVGRMLPLYPLNHRPATPLHVDQLPPPFRRLARKIRFDRLRFPDAERLQPAEHVAYQPSVFEDEVAYLAADGVTVRPILGKEGEFAAFCDRVRGEFPEEATRLRFEVPDGS
jgi:hypothetical protein